MALPADELKAALSLRYLGCAVDATGTLRGPPKVIDAIRRGAPVLGQKVTAADARRILAAYQRDLRETLDA